MGAKNSLNQNMKFYSIVNGRWVTRVDKDTEGAVSRQLENGPREGATVYELVYDTFDGYVRKGEIESGEYGQQIKLELVDDFVPDAEVNVLTIPAESGYGRTLMMRWPFVQFDLPVTLRPYSFEDTDGKKRIGMSVYQDGTKYDSFWTKDNPKDMPPGEQIQKGKEVKWDFTKQYTYLVNYFESHQPEERKVSVSEDSSNASSEGAPDFENMGEVGEDDLPF